MGPLPDSAAAQLRGWTLAARLLDQSLRIRAVNLIAVAIPVDDAEEIESALAAARAAVQGGARLVEWRVDALIDPLLPERAMDAMSFVRRLVTESPAPCIVTVRSEREGGAFRGDDTDRVSFMEALGADPTAPRYLDVELAVFERSANLRQKVRLSVMHERQPRDLKTSLILSSHDFEGRPTDLQKRVAAMVSEPACAVVKVAWRARSLRDNLEAFELLRERAKPTVALCMGEFGLMSRVLAPKFGGFFTFARGATTEETAAGQPTVRELRDRWRYGRIRSTTQVYGVIGWPVSHSRSPDLHNAAFDATATDAIHLPMPVEASWESFKATLGAMIDFEPLMLGGVSVTLPHKEHLVRFVRERGGTMCPISARCGSANTLIIRRGGADATPHAQNSLHAANTDVPAAIAALGGESALRGRCVALLGAGGVGRALAFGLCDAGARLLIFNRTRARAEALVAELESAACVGTGASPRAVATVGGTLDDAARHRDHIEIIVNATSLGMRGEATEARSPLPGNFEFNRGMVVMDTVYTPRLTPFLLRARAAGATIIDGSEMFVRQAEAQFKMWIGSAPPGGLFRSTLDALDALATRASPGGTESA